MKLQLTLLTFLLCLNVEASSYKENFVSSALTRLPKQFQKLNIKVSFSKLNEKSLTSPCESQGFIYGKYNKNEITLSEQLLDHLTPSNEIDFPCKHGNYYNTALATLVHEYFHAYEDTLKKKERPHSKDEFLSLGFWKLNRKNKNLNTYAQRSPNLYEYTSPKEFTAVNFEYFILDPQFKCRRPNLYSAYKKELSYSPFQDTDCNSLLEISISDTQKVDLLELDFNKVREVHYLYASKGKSAMSRWGHSMYKLLICDEDWTIKKCRIRGKFVVIGFLAQVSDISTNALKGIFGKYPSDMTITTLDAIKRQYNRSELRDLESIPLSFDNKEKERFLNHLVRIYWEYSGKYYFFSNNCADEAFKLIQVAKNSREIYSKSILSPISIYKYIKKNNLSKDYSFTNRDINIKNGLLYSSFSPKLDISFQRLKSEYKNQFKIKLQSQQLNINTGQRHFKPKTKAIKDIHEYSLLSIYKRRDMIEEITKSKNKKTLLDLFAIESQANFITNNAIFSNIQNKASKNESNEEINEILSRIVELKNIITFGSNSIEIGYGIPQLGDLEDLSNQESLEQEELKKKKILLQEKYKIIFNDDFLEMEESDYNKTIIKNALRSIL